MPAQHVRPRAGLRKGTGRGGIPHPGVGGYGYPRGPYGRTGFPGSTPAALGRVDHSQGPDGRKDPQFRGRPTLTNPDVWARDTGPAAVDTGPTVVPKPQQRYGENPFRPGRETGPSQFIRGGGKRSGTPRQPYARQMRSTRPEHRMTPHVGDLRLENHKEVRNDIAQRIWATPQKVREYRPAPNPGKTGAHIAGPAQYHPGTFVYGDPDGGPIPAMPYNPDLTPPLVTVPSRYVSHEGAQEGYAMNRPMLFTKGGTPPEIPHGMDPHIRGARMSGQRYFGAIEDQQRIGLPSDSYGIVRRRGPRHRPVRFDVPVPWAANYYDVPGNEGVQDPDMIHRSPSPRPRRTNAKRAREGAHRTGRR